MDIEGHTAIKPFLNLETKKKENWFLKLVLKSQSKDFIEESGNR